MAKPNIKFYRQGTAPSNPQEGFIWFNSSNNTIQLYKNSAWEIYTGKINDVTYSGGKLTITPHSGNSTVIDLSAVGNIGDLSTRLGTLETNFNTLSGEFTTEKGKISTLQGDMNTVKAEVAKLEGITDKVTTYVVGKITAHEEARVTIDQGFENRISGLETTTGQHTGDITDLKGLVGNTAVSTQISNAIAKLDNNGKTGTGSYVDVTVTQVDGVVTTVTVADGDLTTAFNGVNKAISDEGTRAATKEGELESAINTQKGRIDTLLGEDAGSIRDIAIDVLTETLVDENAADAYDTLTEMSAWIKEHPENAATMSNTVNQHTTAIATLNGSATTAGSVAKAVADAKAALEGTFKSGETSKTLAAINADVDALETKINNLDATVKDETGYVTGSIVQTNGKLTSVSFEAVTGSVANNVNALAVASDVKSYVDSTWTWAEF